jgi:hypothetical protein
LGSAVDAQPNPNAGLDFCTDQHCHHGADCHRHNGPDRHGNYRTGFNAGSGSHAASGRIAHPDFHAGGRRLTFPHSTKPATGRRRTDTDSFSGIVHADFGFGD